ncbi:hypothetical protein O181_056393 [Austropuccinia psidii MF-1]|uniref:Uncharacterized protein n=1 Tax=Austropuccinia psidii MF-1 TaxID=1389203 RepID=A0A9Q3E9I5_9BASI|nr:hypothetical protein [Austropuccinia psidii MF-1]
MDIHSGKACPHSHSPSNSTATSNQESGQTWNNYFSSTNSSKTSSNGEWKRRDSIWGKLAEDISMRDFYQGPYGNNQRLVAQQAVIALKREGSQAKGKSRNNTGCIGAMHPKGEYSDSIRVMRSGPTQHSSGFTTLIVQNISGQE